jgi:hypothetical protein
MSLNQRADREIGGQADTHTDKTQTDRQTG